MIGAAGLAAAGLARAGANRHDVKRTSLKKALAMLKQGSTAAEVTAAQQASRKWATEKKKVGPENAIKAKKRRVGNKSTLQNSTRLLARKVEVPNASVARILKSELNVKPLKRVKTTHNAATKKKKRHLAAQDIAGMYKSGMRADEIFFSGETRLSCGRRP